MGAGSQNGIANISYTEFLLRPFPGVQESRHFLAIPFFGLFLFIITANSALIYTVRSQESLHSPMHLLTAFLFAVDICGTVTVVPKMLLSLMFRISRISLTSCLVQMFFIYFSTALDCNTLFMMALDRYVAICHPLHYPDIMTSKLLALLIFASVMWSITIVGPVVILASRVQFCRSSVISHFACEHMALMRLSCGNISINKTVGLALRCIFMIFNLSFLLTSYSKIVHTALKISPGSVRHKAFHTCGTHLMVIFLVYTSRLSSSIVFRLARNASQDIHNLISAIYLLLPWTVNPIIYGVRMKEIKDNLLKLCQRICPPHRNFKATSSSNAC
ncbi:olfactory receptor 52K1-like [Tiliqua scincoides]|uniref:olfactory receptor 52K1-like n=1 Tax=Tiliqua scincoides TaxID=71010 RepID=UPI003462EB32